MWDPYAIAEAVCRGLERAERRRTVEQSPFGIESLSEAELHPLIADGLRAAGFGALREQPYPGEWVAKKPRKRAGGLPDERQRNRCDLVVTPRAGLRLADRLAEAKAHEAVAKKMAGTLFEERALAEVPRHAGDAVGVEEALWLEVKTSGQFAYCDGVPVPCAYGGGLLRGIATDLRKLRSDVEIVHGAAVAVLFCAGQEVGRHDLGVLAGRCADKGLLASVPAVGGVAVPDRIGNRWCAVGVFTPSRGALVE